MYGMACKSYLNKTITNTYIHKQSREREKTFTHTHPEPAYAFSLFSIHTCRTNTISSAGNQLKDFKQGKLSAKALKQMHPIC